ncbi:hypothetical protein AYO44_15800 [Planctomycetaceae bacterium SCGC AG-212-F19]|nr:hypothetical protein AYO44_15800 [Planctomycetaceae bacterium SCGC AG-212-F19]
MLEVHRSSKPLSAQQVLEGVARAFGAEAAGVAFPLEGVPAVQHQWSAGQGGETNRVLPWEEQPQLLTPLRIKPTASVRCNGATRTYLLGVMPGTGSKNRLLWVAGSGEHLGRGSDEAALVVAARVLAPLFPLEPAGDRVFPGLDPTRLQERLQDAGTISARIAHAFDNILTGILGFAELTLGQTEASSQNRSFLEEVVRAAQQGVLLTQQLHFFSRCAVPTVGPATMAYVVGEEQARLQGLLPPGVRLNVDMPAELPSVVMDAELLRQVIGHLLDNAREAITKDGVIGLAARRTILDPAATGELLGQPVPGPCLEVVVTDTGPEITPDVRRRLFQEPFYSTKPRHRGLGLAIVYRVLQAHRASFRLTTGPKETAVHLYLPLAST